MQGTEHENGLRLMAASAERRNQPVFLVAVSGLILAGAFVFAYFAWSGAARAERSLVSANTEYVKVVRAAEEMRALLSDDKDDPDRAQYKPFPRMLSRLDEIHRRLGMETGPTIREGRPTHASMDAQVVGKTVKVTLTDVPLERVFEWVNAALDEIPGLRVTNITVRTSTRAWIIDVDLLRWELKQ